MTGEVTSVTEGNDTCLQVVTSNNSTAIHHHVRVHWIDTKPIVTTGAYEIQATVWYFDSLTSTKHTESTITVKLNVQHKSKL